MDVAGQRPSAKSTGESQIQTRKPFVGFNPTNVPPSQYVYLQDNDSLTLFTYVPAGTLTLRINYRYLTPQGEIKEGQRNITTFTIGFFLADFFTLGECWLLSLTAQILNPSFTSAWVWLQLGVSRTPQAIGTAQGTIWSGFVYQSFATGWPGTPQKEQADGSGKLLSVVGSAPAAGADINEAVPFGRRRTLLAARAVLTTSAAVANRIVNINLDDGANVFHAVANNAAQAASLSVGYNFTPGQQFFSDTQGDVTLPLPPVVTLKGGFRIRTATTGIQAADQWTSLKYLVLDWGEADT